MADAALSDLDMEAQEFLPVEGRRTKRRRTHEEATRGYESDSSACSGSTILSTAERPPTMRKEKIPPIVIKSPGDDWMQLIKYLKSLNCHLEAKFVGQRLHILCQSALSFRIAQREVLRRGLQFHTFCLQEDAELKTVIRGLPPTTLPDDIMQELQDMGFTPTAVSPLQRKDASGRHDTNTHYVRFRKVGDWAKIWDVTSLLCVRVSVSSFAARQGLPQCYRCQNFNHSSAFCNLSPRCVKCAGPHLKKDCTADPEAPAKCCNCGGAHTASYKGCDSHRRAMEAMRRRDAPGRNPSQRRAPPQNTTVPSRAVTQQQLQRKQQPTQPAVNVPQPPKVTQPVTSGAPKPAPRRRRKKKRETYASVAGGNPPPSSATRAIPTNSNTPPSCPTPSATPDATPSATDPTPTPTQAPVPTPRSPSSLPNTTDTGFLSAGAVMEWITTIIPIVMGPPLPPAQLLAQILQSFQKLLALNGQTA